MRTPGGEQRVWHVTESGFYRAIGQRQVGRIKDTAAQLREFRFIQARLELDGMAGEPPDRLTA